MLTSKQKEKCHKMTKGSKIRYAVDDKHKAELEQAGFICETQPSKEAKKVVQAKATIEAKGHVLKGLNTKSKDSEEE
tara:strand:+ start:1084 stop:1314 length:231 start_codon:yes stop_codon:yes gene_type:complete